MFSHTTLFYLLGFLPFLVISIPIPPEEVENTNDLTEIAVSYETARASGVPIHSFDDLIILTDSTTSYDSSTPTNEASDTRDLHPRTIGTLCETSNASPNYDTVKILSRYFHQIGDNYCCQKGLTCVEMARLKTAEVSMCAEKPACIKCEMVRRSIDTILDRCPAKGGKVGGKIGILDGKIDIVVYHS